MGDPETPIFNGVPYSILYATADYNNSGQLVVDAGIDDARICVSSVGSDPTYYETYIGRTHTFDTGYGDFDVWITKQNYIPKHFTVTRSFTNITPIPLAEIVSISPNPATSYVTIKYTAPLPNSTLQVSFTNISGGLSFQYDLPIDEDEITISISHLPNGIYSVNLIENGRLSLTSERLIKQ